jgi:hypothetical protein
VQQLLGDLIIPLFHNQDTSVGLLLQTGLGIGQITLDQLDHFRQVCHLPLFLGHTSFALLDLLQLCVDPAWLLALFDSLLQNVQVALDGVCDQVRVLLLF